MTDHPLRQPLPFPVARPVVGMVHLLPLPGAPAHGPGSTRDGTLRRAMDMVLDRARADAETLEKAGVDGIMVENFGDTPFYPDRVPPETVATMALAVAAVRDVAADLPVGVNVLRNDARAAVGLAAATGAAFVRVNVHVGTMWTDQGALTGRAHATLRERARLGVSCPILADVHVKHATPLPGEALEDAARDAWYRGGASGLVVSGAGTGAATDPDRVSQVADAIPEAPVWVGSGVTPESLGALWPRAGGFVVGSSLQEGGRAGQPVDPQRARTFMQAVHRLRDAG